jgi:hypothetical protein
MARDHEGIAPVIARTGDNRDGATSELGKKSEIDFAGRERTRRLHENFAGQTVNGLRHLIDFNRLLNRRQTHF